MQELNESELASAYGGQAKTPLLTGKERGTDEWCTQTSALIAPAEAERQKGKAAIPAMNAPADDIAAGAIVASRLAETRDGWIDALRRYCR